MFQPAFPLISQVSRAWKTLGPPRVYSGSVTWDKSLTSVAEHTILAVPAPGQLGRESKGCDPPPCHTGHQKGGSCPGKIYMCLLLILRLLPDRWARPTLRPREGQKAAPVYTVDEPHIVLPFWSEIPLPQLLLPEHPPHLVPPFFLPRPESGGSQALSYLLSLGQHLPSAIGREEGQEKMVSQDAGEERNLHTVAKETETAPCAIPFLLLPV